MSALVEVVLYKKQFWAMHTAQQLLHDAEKADGSKDHAESIVIGRDHADKLLAQLNVMLTDINHTVSQLEKRW